MSAPKGERERDMDVAAMPDARAIYDEGLLALNPQAAPRRIRRNWRGRFVEGLGAIIHSTAI
jgi:hypothetical protein